jgi:raffinose/stachyose/melibiose transport system substrate-binding protein
MLKRQAGDRVCEGGKVIPELIGKFEKSNCGIKIRIEAPDEDRYYQPQLEEDLEEGNTPDLFFTWPGPISDRMNNSGEILDLREYLNGDTEWKNSFYNGTIEQIYYKDRCFGIPFEGFVISLYYNKDIFGEYGITVPETVEQMKYSISELKNKGIIPISAAVDGGWTLALYWNMLVNRIMGVNETRKAYERFDFNHKGFMQATVLLKELFDKKAFPEKFWDMSKKEDVHLFTAEKAAMYFHGSWNIENFSNASNEFYNKVGIIPFPVIGERTERKNDLCFGVILSLSLAKKLKNHPDKLDASLRLAKYLTSRENASYMSGMTKRIFPVKLDIDKGKDNDVFHEVLKSVDECADTFTIITMIFPDRLKQALFNGLEKVLKNEIETKTFMEYLISSL